MVSKTLRVDKRTLIAWCACGLCLFPLAFGITDLLGVGGIFKLALDALWVLALALIPLGGRCKFSRKLLPHFVVVTALALITLVVYLFRYKSVFYYIWGFRNYFRFFVIFFATAIFCTRTDADKSLALLDKFFWINAILAVVQFFMGYEQDNIGGLFGVSIGCNGYLVIFLIVVTTRSLLLYMQGEERALSCFAKSGTALVISALAELKFFFFIFVLILIMSMILTSFSFRKVLIVIVGALLLSVTTILLEANYGYFEGFLSLENLLRIFTQRNYASASDIGRFTAIPVLSEKFLPAFWDRMFGLGLGNCDVSSISLFHTAFYDIYVDLHYSIFSYAFMFLENGYVGLILYFSFFVLCFFTACSQLKKRTGNTLHCQMAIIISVICLILAFYNSSLRTEAGYMIYFVLALPLIKREPAETAVQ